jgi:hypothetical protein
LTAQPSEWWQGTKKRFGEGVRKTEIEADYVNEDGSFKRTAKGIEICVPTMMQSGTHLLRFEILRRFHKGNPTALHYFDGETDNRSFVFHLHEPEYQYIYQSMMEQLPVFTSLRHPYRMWQSYLRRQTKDRMNHTIDLFNLQWNRQINVTAKYNPMYVHVDNEEIRDKQVDEMGKFLNLPLKTNWPVNNHSGSVHGMHKVKIQQDKRISKEFIDFYYETMNNNSHK